MFNSETERLRRAATYLKQNLQMTNQLTIRNTLGTFAWSCLMLASANAGEPDAMVSLHGNPQIAGAEAGEADGGGENASNPLAKVKNTDLRWQHSDLGSGRSINDFFIDGAFMATDKLKIKYELHYWETDVTGSSQAGWESLVIKPIYFPTEGAWGSVKYRIAVGVDWIVDLGDDDKGIGLGSDQIGPFGGVALGFPTKTMLIPLLQHFISYSGNDVNSTAVRLIALQPLPHDTWLKLDAKLPIDWEADEAIRGISEIQFGKTINKYVALYADGLVGYGGGKTFDWGAGLGLRITY
jgi:hypothetical protein